MLQDLTYPQSTPINGDLATSLLLPLPPLHQVQAVVDGQGHVPLADRGVDGSREEVRLGVQRHLHAIGQNQPQGAIQTDEVAVANLICIVENYYNYVVKGEKHQCDLKLMKKDQI